MTRRLCTLMIALVTASIPLVPTAASARTPATAPAVVCLPEAPVCAGIAGSPGNYYYQFRFQPPPTGLSLSFTVNGAIVPGSVTYESGPTYLRGTWRPFTPLVSGDEVCMTVSGTPEPYCDTVP
ncbi:hypothetical protein ACFY4C_24340 [Actinomadura viridis]|uniref:hypothetical protein n=1 Tax=Actinomadura viridis TaxID=58110 RepID=UPI0036A1CFF5